MKRALVLLLLAPGLVAGAEEARAFVEVEAPRACYAGEPVRLVLRVGIDRDWFEEHAVQLFQRRLDIAVQLQAPWLEELAGATLRKPVESGGLTLVLNGKVIRARRSRDRTIAGQSYTVVEIARTCLPTLPGERTLGAPQLRYAYATRFLDDFVYGRRPEDRRDAFVRGEARTLTVRPLPAKGRPPRFTGAVGSFHVGAEASPRTLDAGAVMRLVLRIEGKGNLELFATPRLALDGFHVYGRTDDKGPARRTITYDLAPLRALNAVPAIPFSFFDPEAGAYRIVRTDPIALNVRPMRQAEPPASPTPEPGSSLLLYLAAAALLLLALRGLMMLRTRRGAVRDPARDAAAQFAREVDGDLAGAFTGYLAARLGCPGAAVIDPDLQRRLEAAGLPTQLAARTAILAEELVARRYGSVASRSRVEDARALIALLEGFFGHPPTPGCPPQK